jgi:hypothetical protein
MPASSPTSEELLLHGLIWAGLWLAAGSVLVWIGCFVVRLRRLRRAAQEAAVEERLSGRVLDELAGYPAAADAYAGLSRWEQHVLLRVLQDLVEQVKGGDRDKLLALMQRVGFRQAALEGLGSFRLGERRTACRVLGYFDQPEAIAALRRALRDRDLPVRLIAARALLQKDKVESLHGLLADLDFSPDNPPLMLAELFAHLPASLRPEAVRLLGEPIPEEWRRMLAIALGRNQVHEAYDAIAALTGAASPRVRAAAWVALRDLGDPLAGDLVVTGLGDANASVRRAACRCAGAFGGAAVRPLLGTLLDDRDWWVRFEAASALLETGPEGRRRLEQHSLAAGDDDVGLQVLREKEMEVPDGR